MKGHQIQTMIIDEMESPMPKNGRRTTGQGALRSATEKMRRSNEKDADAQTRLLRAFRRKNKQMVKGGQPGSPPAGQ